MKTLIDIDDELLAEAMRILGTTTKKATVNAALAEVTALEARRRHIDQLTDLADGLADARGEAWRS